VTARLLVPQAVRAETEAAFAACGHGQRECVVFWAAPLTDARRVRRVIHPAHDATWAATRVDASDVWRLNVELLTAAESIVAQVHTHPGVAFHSATDDANPLVGTPGFLSLVVPHFGRRGLVDLAGCAAFCLRADGSWDEVRTDVVEWT
jgi:hypothetical protein